MTPDVSIVIFAWNEAEGLEGFLRELEAFVARAPFSVEVIFVDDGSSDGTGEIAKRVMPSAIHLRHETNRGIGAALKTGAGAASGAFLTFLPADGQIPPETVATLFSATPEKDVVFSVYDGRRDDGAHRSLLSFGVRALIAILHGVHMRSDGPYMIRRELFDPAQLEADTFFLNFEVPIRATAAKLRTATVPSDCRPRAHGASKSANLRTIARVARDLFALRLR